jgi:hypothetical protein
MAERAVRQSFAYHLHRDDDGHAAPIGYMSIGALTLDHCPPDCPNRSVATL